MIPLTGLARKTTALSNVERGIVCYLAAPLFVFNLGWLSPAIGIPCTFLLAGLLYLLISNKEPSVSSLSRSSILIAIGAATLWTLLSGAGNFLYANPDWKLRSALLNDLVSLSWPTSYGVDGDAILLLRYPLAYYLLPAGLSKFTGISFAHPLIFLWTLLGVSLLFLSFCATFASSRQLLGAVLTFILFSGLDIVGSLLNNHQLSVTSHLEWWAAPFQYSSQSTMLFWAPNHALPGWLAATLIVRHWRDPLFPATLAAILMLTLLWSPLTAIGIAIVLLWLTVYHFMSGNWRWALSPVIILAVLSILPIMKYLSLHAGDIKSGWIGSFYLSKSTLFKNLGQFWLCEVVCFFPLFVLDRKERFLTALSVLSLFVIPAYYYGPSNDFVMRASIPILAILALRSAATIRDQFSLGHFGTVIFLLIILATGAVTPGTEIIRAVTTPAWAPDLQATVIDFPLDLGSHYYTWVEKSSLFPLSPH